MYSTFLSPLLYLRTAKQHMIFGRVHTQKQNPVPSWRARSLLLSLPPYRTHASAFGAGTEPVSSAKCADIGHFEHSPLYAQT